MENAQDTWSFFLTKKHDQPKIGRINATLWAMGKVSLGIRKRSQEMELGDPPLQQATPWLLGSLGLT